MKLRVEQGIWNALDTDLRRREDVETAAVILAEPVGSDVYIARQASLVPEGGYLLRALDRIRIAPEALNRLVRPARDAGFSILTVHTHPGASEPWFSAADDAGDKRLMPSLYNQCSGPHGSLVLATATGKVSGRVWLEDGRAVSLDVRLVGPLLRHGYVPMATGSASGVFNRQELALGAHGQAILRKLHVGVVGLGGTGSVVAAQLSHLGVGKVTLVDGDRVERSNVSRIVGARLESSIGVPKVDIATRYSRELGLPTKVASHASDIGEDFPADMLVECDVIFSCVDRHTPRALLNRLAYEFLVPVIDMGSGFHVDSRGRIAGAAGRVIVVGPGRPCLACWGVLDPQRLMAEAMSPAERVAAAVEGYLSGAMESQPSVMAFNTLVAGAAVVELLRVVTAFAGADDPPERLSFDFEKGIVRRNRVHGRVPCRICSASCSEEQRATVA